MEQKENKLMNLDLPKTSFQGFFTKKISVNGKETEQEFAKIKYAEDQTFNVLSLCFKKHLVNDTQELSTDGKIHSSNWVDKNAKATEYDFIRIAMNPEKDVQISIKTPEFDTVTGKSVFKYNKVSFKNLCAHLQPERDKVVEIKNNPKLSREKSINFKNQQEADRQLAEQHKKQIQP